jgi:Lhr-like helicase
MELGIDVGELDVVMQLGYPSTVESFKQKLGRTGEEDKELFRTMSSVQQRRMN